MTARLELSGRELGLANIEQKEGLNAVDVVLARAIELTFDDVKQLAMQAFYKSERTEIALFEILSADRNFFLSDLSLN